MQLQHLAKIFIPILITLIVQCCRILIKSIFFIFAVFVLLSTFHNWKNHTW